MKQISCALDFALSLDYDHVGLSKNAYLAHPLRVASMLIDYCQDYSIEDIEIALLHNVYEVGKEIKPDDIRKQFGDLVEASISTLTVDRANQWDAQYKSNYYEAICGLYVGAARVKILDKLDNIFLINNNPDDSVRRMYLTEINKFIIPMSKQFIPIITEPFRKAVSIAMSSGYRPVEENV